jgi:hypothetical protein
MSSLKEARQSLGLSQLQMATLMGMHQGHYSDIERGANGRANTRALGLRAADRTLPPRRPARLRLNSMGASANMYPYSTERTRHEPSNYQPYSFRLDLAG